MSKLRNSNRELDGCSYEGSSMTTEEESYLTNCLLSPRRGEIIFHIKHNGEILASLRGYAIIPVEEYERLAQSEVATKKT